MPLDSAVFISAAIPDAMLPGETRMIAITVKNTGDSIWAELGEANQFRLGAADTGDAPYNNEFLWNNFYFGGYSNDVLDQMAFIGWTVEPGDNFVFVFGIQAPADTGLHWLTARMVHEGVKWFSQPIYKPIYASQAGVSVVPELSLYPALKIYPNHAREKVVIYYSVTDYTVTDLRLTVYDITGRIVKEFTPSSQGGTRLTNSGVIWDASTVSSGVYFCTMKAGKTRLTEKILLVK